jgi:dihydrofolate reductase
MIHTLTSKHPWRSEMDKLVLVVAMSRNGVIGRDGELPWHIPEDLKHFRRVTIGHAIIMGRKTWESIGGRPLPKRQNIVVTRQRDWQADGCEVAHSLEEAVAIARRTDDAPRVVGGAMLYEAALPLATTMMVTEVAQEVEGDTFFPDFERTAWLETERTSGQGVSYVTLERSL